MTGTHVEGTIVLNGLVEGPLPDSAGFRDRLRQWARDVAKLGLDFQPEIAGSTFSLLPHNEPRSCRALGDVPHDAITQALEQLLELLPHDAARRVTSTLRSSEFRKGEEVQAVYMIRPDCHVHAEHRTIAADTESPPQSLAPRDIIRLLLAGLVVAAALLGITSLFVDLPGLARQFVSTLRPVRAESIEVDDTHYAPFFTAGVKDISSSSLTLTLTRTPEFPANDQELQQAADNAQGNIKEWLAVAALARGEVRCDLYDTSGKFAASATIRVDALRDQPTINVEVPLKSTPRFRLGKIACAL